jgi:acyl dehydratase
VKDTAPLTFPHVLASAAHGGDLRAFPFPAIGTLHLANSITQHRPVVVGETLQLEVHASSVRPDRKVGRSTSRPRRADGETVWESTSTYLRRGGGDAVVSTGSTDARRGPGAGHLAPRR